MRDADDGVRHGDRRYGWGKAPCAEGDLLEHEAEHSGDCKYVALPVREHRANALVEVVERGPA